MVKLVSILRFQPLQSAGRLGGRFPLLILTSICFYEVSEKEAIILPKIKAREVLVYVYCKKFHIKEFLDFFNFRIFLCLF